MIIFDEFMICLRLLLDDLGMTLGYASDDFRMIVGMVWKLC